MILYDIDVSYVSKSIRFIENDFSKMISVTNFWLNCSFILIYSKPFYTKFHQTDTMLEKELQAACNKTIWYTVSFFAFHAFVKAIDL